MIPIDEEILAGHILEGEAIWENEEASKFATGDWLAATADELSEETGVPRQRVVNSLLGKCAFHWRSGHYKTLQARELVSRRWPQEKRERLPNLSYTHYRRIGDDEELAQKANEGMWSVQQIEEYKTENRTTSVLTTAGAKALIIEYDELCREMDAGHTWNGESATLKAKKWEQIMTWAKG